MDLGELEKLANSAPRLRAGLDGKLHKGPPAEQRDEELDKAAWALARAVGEAEGTWIHRKLKHLLPRREYEKAASLAKGGDTFTMRKLLNEYEVKITSLVGGQEVQQADFDAGIQRRHLQIWRGTRLMGERVWEWSRVG